MNRWISKIKKPEEVFICIKYLILIREWFKEAQKPMSQIF